MIYDISTSIHEDMIVYKNREAKKPALSQSASFEKQGVYETNITMNLHTGTHIDFPLHTLEQGATSDSLNLNHLLGEARVFDLTACEDKIMKKDLVALDIEPGDFVLFKTTNSFDTTFNFNWVYVSLDAALYLKEKKVRGVGLDALGIERDQEGHPTHDTLLKEGIIILEGINLKEVKPATYKFYCLPLKIDAVEALPVRALLETR